MSAKDQDILHHLEALRRYARVLTRSADGADDLVQGALLRAYERRSGFREGADLRVWLLAILHNLYIDQMRSKRASDAREQAWADLNPGFVDAVGEQAARLSQLRAAFLTLPAEQREALHLVAIEGLSILEAGNVLNVPPGTVMSRIGRARSALRGFEDGPGKASPKPNPLKLVRGRHDATD